MIKRIQFALFLGIFLTLFSVQSFAQVEKGQLVDGIAAVIGDEIVLESDVQEQLNYVKQQGANNVEKCEVMGSIVNNKLLVYLAKKDTLIENRSAAIKENAEQKYNQILSSFPDEKTMLESYKFRTGYEMKNAIEKIDGDQYYMQAKYQRITEHADVTPNEVTDFYNQYQSQFPEIKDEVTLAQIVKYPKLTEAHKDSLINRLKKIKEDILAGEDFAAQARIYSEDPGSAQNGGLMKNVPKGQMVKPFEAAALNLQEGEISDPVETEFGFHLIRLEKKSGKIYDVSHILLLAVPTKEEIASAKKELDSIKTLITQNKITFKEAAFKFSDDKRTKFNAGVVQGQDGSSKLEKIGLAADVAYQITGLNKGDITDAFEDELNKRKVVEIIRLENEYPAHQLTFENDYDRIKELALNKKKNEILEKWIKEQVPTVFISINKRYNDCNFQSKWKNSSILTN